MPFLPVGQAPAPLILFYKIPLEQFTLLSPQYGYQSLHSVEIAVEEQPNYPDILPSVWTVQLAIMEKDGAVTATISPKEAKSSGTMMVEYIVRTAGSCDYKIELEKCRSVGAKLYNLVEVVKGSCGQYHYRLNRSGSVFVSLIFYPEKSSKESRKERLDLKRLRESQTLSDCKMICAGQQFPVHRAILAAQSPVFAAMSQHNMLEKSSGVCKIDDIGADVLEIMINFAYTRAPFEANNLVELWHAADKYDMEDLRHE
ncbi:speckle-type POZ protein-like [Paramacrobiotus metropolitanus]|uniref:speckle-type POZ protein-like n=1 Tax=Paramacrobiotus metropolitanus TaxID=2943436 RepID=UPI002445D57B|nr:speckle-type POZ protein-like [Paramacrobiotus metropolitanus]